MYVIDYVLIVVICLSSIGIGIYSSCSGGRQKSTKEYLMGNKQMSLLPVAISILVSFWSAVSLLGSPAEIFYYGSYYNLTAIGIALACAVSAFTFVPLFYPLPITSIYEYLELRYKNKWIRYWSTLLYVLTTILYLAVAQLAPAIALDSVVGIPQWAGILIISVISVIYTALGGIKAVIWSDVFQSVFIVIGLFAIVIKALTDAGGVSAAVNVNAEWQRLDHFRWSPDPRVRLTVWTSTIGAMFGWIPWYGPNQAAFQRFASLPTLAKAKMSILLNIFGIILLFGLLAITGYALFAFYALTKGCDPWSAGFVDSINQVMPHYIKTELDIPAFGGILIACILSGALSTTSTVLNSQAAVTVTDFVQPWMHLSDERATLLTKWLVVAYGVLGSCIAFLSSFITGVSLAEISGSLLNASTGATLGIYLLAACVPSSSWQGAMVGSIVSLSVVGWVCIGSLVTAPSSSNLLPLPHTNCSNQSAVVAFNNENNYALPTGISGFYSISFQWYGLIGAMSCFITGIIVSIVVPPTELPDNQYIMPFVISIVKKFNGDYNKVQIEMQESNNKKLHADEINDENNIDDENDKMQAGCESPINSAKAAFPPESAKVEA